MSWGREILRAFLLAFGTMETFTNLTFLIRENGLVSARKQHKIPELFTILSGLFCIYAILEAFITGIGNLWICSGLHSFNGYFHNYFEVYTSAVSCNTFSFSISRDLLLTEQMTPSLSNCPSLRLTVSLATPR